MLIDIGRPVKQLNREVITDDKDEPVTCGMYVKQALLLEPLDAEGRPVKRISGEDKYKRFKLADRIEEAGSMPVDITVDEAKLIKDLVGELFTPLIVGQIYDMIETAKQSPSAKPKVVK